MKEKLNPLYLLDFNYDLVVISDDKDELTFSKKSPKKNYQYCIVWHLKENKITISHHDIVDGIGGKMITDIERLFQGKVTTQAQLKLILECVEY